MLFTFSGKPKLQEFGFWSLTVYGASGYLIPNPLGRFEVGDRTGDLVYQNGNGTVYGAGAKEEDDGRVPDLAAAGRIGATQESDKQLDAS